MPLKNIKKLYQFNNYLTHQPNQKGQYTVGIKDNKEDTKLIDGNFDNSFYSPKINAYTWQAEFDIYDEFGVNDIDFLLHEWKDKNSTDGSILSSNYKKTFWVNNNCEDSTERPRVYFNYGYADSTTINYSEENSQSEIQIKTNLKLLKPFFFECTRDLFLLDRSKLQDINLYGYDWNAFYNSTQVYDLFQSYLVNPNDPTLTTAELNQYFDCCEKKQSLLLYKDFFNLANLKRREITNSIATRRDNQTLVVNLGLNQNFTTSTDRSNIVLGSPYPVGWTGGKLDLNTSRKSEIMVIELDTSIPTNYWIKIKNLDNDSYLKLTWRATTNNGQSGQLQIYPHLGQVWANGLLANPLTDYTLEVDSSKGSLYFDSLYQIPNLPPQLAQVQSQALLIEQSSIVANTLYIQTLKTFY